VQRTYASEVGRTERKPIPLLHRVLTCKKKERKKSGWTKCWGWAWWRLRQADVPAPDCTRGHRPTLRCPWLSCLGSECHQLSFRSRGCLLKKAKLLTCTKLPSGVKFWRQGTILCFSSAGVQRLCRPVSCSWKFYNGLQGIYCQHMVEAEG